VEANVAVAKVGKYATSESGDTLEMVERPQGGLSFVLVDGQRSGRPARAISNVVARKAMALLAEGVRDGAAARAASDYLHNYRSGKVSATLNILSIDMETRTLVVTRNNPAPVYLLEDGSVQALDGPSEAVGTRRGIRPNIHEVPLAPGLAAAVFTDGLLHAGDRTGRHLDLTAELRDLSATSPAEAQIWADTLLQRAVDLDEGRPTDDISILVAAILPKGTDTVRHMQVRVPF
jgi:serine phosphatase RsbU (regulator of sigma subunit)